MSTELAPVPQQLDPMRGMMLAQAGGNLGSIEIESQRAIAEAQGQLTLAKKFPRSRASYMAEFLDTCSSPEFAATAFYAVPNRGSGPSIRFAEEAARCYGNFQYGHRELSRVEATAHSPGRSEVEVYAWDMQNNNFSKRQITVLHVVDTKNGPKRLTDQTDIDNKIANVASKQMRGRILALLPKDMIASGNERAKLTLGGGGEKPLRERISLMTQAFGKFGVTPKLLEAHLKHGLDDTTIDELADLTGIYNAIKDGAKPSEYFTADAPAIEGPASGTAAAVAKQAAKAAETQPAAKAAAKPASKKPESEPKPVEEPAAAPVAEAAAAPDQMVKTDSQPAPAEGPGATTEDDVF